MNGPRLGLNLTQPKTILLVMLVFLGFIIIFINWPRYIILEPPFPDTVFVRIEEKSKITWYSGLPGVEVSESAVWRKYYLIYSDCCDDLKSQQDILSFMDKWLNREGWMSWKEIGSPCAHLAEAEFLERDKEWVAYVPEGTKSLMNSPAVCVAVWPATKNQESFWTLLATSNN